MKDKMYLGSVFYKNNKLDSVLGNLTNSFTDCNTNYSDEEIITSFSNDVFNQEFVDKLFDSTLEERDNKFLSWVNSLK